MHELWEGILMPVEAPNPMDFNQPTWKFVLVAASQGPRLNAQVPFRLAQKDAEELMADLGIELTKGGGVPGELSAVFEYQDEEFTLTKYLGKYDVFGGRWQRDPRWTGD
jgi:hypothetical protein